MDMQKLIDSMGESSRLTRGDYQLTLGGLIKELKELYDHDSDGLIVKFDDGTAPCAPDSYRGYYSDLAFASREEPITVTELLNTVEECLGRTFEGYKGGDYIMQNNTPLWRGEYGRCGPAIMGIYQADDEVILITKDID